MALDKRKIEEYYQQQIDALNEIVKIQEQQIADKYGLKENLVQTFCEKIYKEILRNKTNETKFQAEISELKATLLKISKDKKDQDQDLQLKGKQLAAKENEIARLRQQISQAEDRFNELSASLEQKDRKIESLENDKKKHGQLIDQIEDQVNTLVQQLQAAQFKNEQLQKQIKEMATSAMNYGSKQFAVLEQYVQKLEQKLSKVVDQFSSYRQIQINSMLKQKVLFEKIQSVEAPLGRNQAYLPSNFFNAVENLLGNYETFRKKAMEYQESFEANKNTLKSFEESVKTRELELTFLNKQYEFQIQEKTKQIESLQAELAKTQERLELEESNSRTLKKQYDELRIKNNEIISQATLEQNQLVHSHSQELMKQRNELRDLYEKELLQKQDAIFNLEKELRLVLRQKEELVSTNQELEDELSEKTKKIKSLTAQNNDLMTSLELKEDTLRKMRREAKENIHDDSRSYAEMRRGNAETSGFYHSKTNFNHMNESTASKFLMNSTKKTNVSASKEKPYLEMLEEIEKAAKKALEDDDI